jgi:hypothetical protein
MTELAEPRWYVEQAQQEINDPLGYALAVQSLLSFGPRPPDIVSEKPGLRQ